jgi:hypothetical protein
MKQSSVPARPNHTKGQAYQCALCPEKKVTWQTFQAHVRRFHPNSLAKSSQSPAQDTYQPYYEKY